VPSSAPTAQRLDELEAGLARVCRVLVDCLEMSDRELFWNNVQMAAGSAIGTLAWGFGDLLVNAPPAACHC